MTEKAKEIVVPADEAVFWLDAAGRWHNKYGPFEHKKIIDFFHSSIRRDQNGYYLCQTHNNVTEKVYFHYEDTALFVFDVHMDDEISLVLNTKKTIKLVPEKLLVKNNSLYFQNGDESIKFAERALLKIAPLLEDDNGRYYIRIGNRRHRIRVHEKATGEKAHGRSETS